MRVYITDIRRSRPRTSESPTLYTYCLVKDADTDELLISATLDYALQAIEDRGWQEVKPPGF